MECQKEENLKECNCSYPNCPRKGMCCWCVKHHRERGELPACYFTEKAEKTFDRSVEKFFADKKNQKYPG